MVEKSNIEKIQDQLADITSPKKPGVLGRDRKLDPPRTDEEKKEFLDISKGRR